MVMSPIPEVRDNEDLKPVQVLPRRAGEYRSKYTYKGHVKMYTLTPKNFYIKRPPAKPKEAWGEEKENETVIDDAGAESKGPVGETISEPQGPVRSASDIGLGVIGGQGSPAPSSSGSAIASRKRKYDIPRYRDNRPAHVYNHQHNYDGYAPYKLTNYNCYGFTHSIDKPRGKGCRRDENVSKPPPVTASGTTSAIPSHEKPPPVIAVNTVTPVPERKNPVDTQDPRETSPPDIAVPAAVASVSSPAAINSVFVAQPIHQGLHYGMISPDLTITGGPAWRCQPITMRGVYCGHKYENCYEYSTVHHYKKSREYRKAREYNHVHKYEHAREYPYAKRRQMEAGPAMIAPTVQAQPTQKSQKEEKVKPNEKQKSDAAKGAEKLPDEPRKADVAQVKKDNPVARVAPTATAPAASAAPIDAASAAPVAAAPVVVAASVIGPHNQQQQPPTQNQQTVPEKQVVKEIHHHHYPNDSHDGNRDGLLVAGATGAMLAVGSSSTSAVVMPTPVGSQDQENPKPAMVEPNTENTPKQPDMNPTTITPVTVMASNKTQVKEAPPNTSKVVKAAAVTAAGVTAASVTNKSSAPPQSVTAQAPASAQTPAEEQAPAVAQAPASAQTPSPPQAKVSVAPAIAVGAVVASSISAPPAAAADTPAPSTAPNSTPPPAPPAPHIPVSTLGVSASASSNPPPAPVTTAPEPVPTPAPAPAPESVNPPPPEAPSKANKNGEPVPENAAAAVAVSAAKPQTPGSKSKPPNIKKNKTPKSAPGDHSGGAALASISRSMDKYRF